jgi:hypothetical protein
MAHSTGAGGDDPFDPWDLDDVRERVVMPVVSSLIRPADLQKVEGDQSFRVDLSISRLVVRLTATNLIPPRE